MGTTSSADTCAEYILVPNNSHDVGIVNGTSTEPYGYSALSAVYAKNLVEKIRYEITYVDPTGDGMFVGIQIQGLLGATAALNLVRQRPRVIGDFIQNTGAQQRTFTGWLYPWQALGLSKIQYLANIDEYAAAFGSDIPSANRLAFRLFASNANKYVNAPSVRLQIKFELYMKCYQLNALS